MKILVVDDDNGTLNALKACLASAGHEAILATDAYKALDKVESAIRGTGSIDLMVTDLKMPGMNGLELIKTVRWKGSRFPAILMTAYGSERLQQDLTELGSCGYLDKPFSPESLLTTIAALTAEITD